VAERERNTCAIGSDVQKGRHHSLRLPANQRIGTLNGKHGLRTFFPLAWYA
jgi:hypothetical protein